MGPKDKCLGALFTSRGPAASYGTELGEEESLPSLWAYSAGIFSSPNPPHPGSAYPIPAGWSLRCTWVFTQAEERPFPLPSDGSPRQGDSQG